MKRLAASVALVLSLIGCGPLSGGLPSGGLLTYDGPCHLMNIRGRLEVDDTYVTAIVQPDGDRTIVAWPVGYTSRPNGSEVDVLNAQGRVVVTTGNDYSFIGSPLEEGVWAGCSVDPDWGDG